MSDRADRLLDRIDLLCPIYAPQVGADVYPTPAGERYTAPGSAERVLRFLTEAFAGLDADAKR